MFPSTSTSHCSLLLGLLCAASQLLVLPATTARSSSYLSLSIYPAFSINPLPLQSITVSLSLSLSCFPYFSVYFFTFFIHLPVQPISPIHQLLVSSISTVLLYPSNFYSPLFLTHIGWIIIIHKLVELTDHIRISEVRFSSIVPVCVRVRVPHEHVTLLRPVSSWPEQRACIARRR